MNGRKYYIIRSFSCTPQIEIKIASLLLIAAWKLRLIYRRLFVLVEMNIKQADCLMSNLPVTLTCVHLTLLVSCA